MKSSSRLEKKSRLMLLLSRVTLWWIPSSLTGESVPREVTVGSDLLSGCININGLLIARVTKEFGDSTVSKILDLVENASNKKSNSENFITKFARYYTPTVVVVAVLLAAIPPLFSRGKSLLNGWLERLPFWLYLAHVR